MRKIVLTLNVLILIVLIGCVNKNTIYEYEVVDMSGEIVKINYKVEKIGITWTSGAQLMITLGMSDMLAAIPEDVKENGWSTYFFPKLLELPSISNENSIEYLLSLDLDLLITADKNKAKEFRDRGITTLVLNYYSVDEMKQALLILNRILEDEYKQTIVDYIDYLEMQIKNVENSLKDIVDEKESLYYIHGQSDRGLYKTAGKDTMNEAWANYAFTEFATSSLLNSNQTDVSAEAIIFENPDIIIIGGKYQKKIGSDLLNTQEWRDVNAVLNQKIFYAPIGMTPFDRFGAEFALMVPFVASKVYSEFFDFNLENEIKHFYSYFMKKELTDEEVQNIINGVIPNEPRKDIK